VGPGARGPGGCVSWGLGPKRSKKGWAPKSKAKKAGGKKSQGRGVAP